MIHMIILEWEGVSKISAFFLSPNSSQVKWEFENLKSANGVASNGVLRRCEDSIDQLGRFALVGALDDRTHRFCGNIDSHCNNLLAMTYASG